MEKSLKKVEKSEGNKRIMQRDGLKIWCLSLVPDWVLPEGPSEPAGHWQGAACGIANACARSMESLHNGCGANDAPGDTNSLAPL